MLFIFVISGQTFAKPNAELPSIEAEVKKMAEAQKKDQKAANISPEDKAVMETAAKDLQKTLPNPGLKVGVKAPDFTLVSAFGKKITLSSQYKKGPVVLTFYRGAWCPYCNIELRALKLSNPHFKKYNAVVIAVTPQQPDKSLAQVKKSGFPFEILSDLDSNVMKQYNLYFELSPALDKVYKKLGLDIEKFNGKGRTVLPVPGTFVIDTKGIIRASFSDLDYKKRMEPKVIVEALKKL